MLLEGMIWNALEATVLALAIFLALKIWKASAPLRHLLWLLVMVKLLIPPFVLNSPCLSSACLEAVRIASSGRGGEKTKSKPNQDLLAESLLELPETALPREEGSPEWFPRGEPAASTPREEEPSIHPAVLPFPPETPWFRVTVAWIWLAGSLLLFLWQGFLAAAFQLRILRSSEPPPREILGECHVMARKLGLRRPPRLRVVGQGLSPMVWSLGRPTVFVSRDLVECLGPACIRSVLAHELAHLKRRDHWVSWLELAGSILYWWLPTFWLARREIRMTADQSADAWAVWASGSRTAYARSLLETVQILATRSLPAPALGRSLGGRKAIERRLIMIMRSPLRHSLSWPAVLGLALLGLLVLPAAPERLMAQGAGVDESRNARSDAGSRAVDEAVQETRAAGDSLVQRAASGDMKLPAGVEEAPAVEKSPEKSPDTERRLQALELKMEAILNELKALQSRDKRSISGRAGGGSNTALQSSYSRSTSQRRVRSTGGELSGGAGGFSGGIRSSGTSRSGSSFSRSNEPAAAAEPPRQYASEGGSAYGSSSRGDRRSTGSSSRADAADPLMNARRRYDSFNRYLDRKELSPGQRRAIDRLNQSLQEGMDRLLQEHMKAIQKVLEEPRDLPGGNRGPSSLGTPPAGGMGGGASSGLVE